MDEKLAKRKVTIKSGISNKRRCIKSPWCNDQLTELWSIKCDAERKSQKCNGQLKVHHQT